MGLYLLLLFLQLSFLLLLVIAPIIWHRIHKKANGLKGPAGWILVFELNCLLTILSFIFSTIQGQLALNLYIHLKDVYFNFSLITGICHVIILSYIIYLIHKGKDNPKTPSKIIKLIWINGPILGIVFWISILIYASLHNHDFEWVTTQLLFTLIGINLVGSVIYAYIWTLYFQNAVRVQNTYGITPKDKHYVKKIIALIILSLAIIAYVYYKAFMIVYEVRQEHSDETDSVFGISAGMPVPILKMDYWAVHDPNLDPELYHIPYERISIQHPKLGSYFALASRKAGVCSVKANGYYLTASPDDLEPPEKDLPWYERLPYAYANADETNVRQKIIDDVSVFTNIFDAKYQRVLQSVNQESTKTFKLKDSPKHQKVIQQQHNHPADLYNDIIWLNENTEIRLQIKQFITPYIEDAYLIDITYTFPNASKCEHFME